MGSFVDVDGGASALTDTDCVKIAEGGGGLLGESLSGFVCPVATAQFPTAPEWGSKRVATQGTGNGGGLVLVGLTARTRGILRKGRIAALVARGIDATIAKHAVSVRYGMERGVAELAQRATAAVAFGGKFAGNSHRDFDEWMGEPCQATLSFWRKCAAAEIAWLACG
jgi:hypothetical protein